MRRQLRQISVARSAIGPLGYLRNGGTSMSSSEISSDER
jgi:hypothetical protein